MLKKLSPKAKKLSAITVAVVLAIYMIYIHLDLFGTRAKIDDHDNLPYLSARIFAENQNDYLINFVSLRDQLNSFAKEKGDHLGLYFEYLPTGSTISINANHEHKFASLLKVPVAMAYYLQSEKEGTPFDQTFEIKQDDLDPLYGDLWKRGAGAKIGAKELIREMLINSDNTALQVLGDNTKAKYTQFVFDNLDIYLDKDANQVDTVSPRKYASIFKALYLSSILPTDKSNEILDILAQSIANDTLAAGVPSQIKVANKIGELKDELYWDCGIIYEPKRPYLVCAFSVSTSSESKEEISTISKMTYDYIHQANTPNN